MFLEVLRCGQFAPVDDIDGAFGSHHGNLGHRISKIHIGPDMLTRHDAVSATVCLARNDRDLRNRGFRESEQQFCAVFDDPAKLLIRSRQKTRNVFERDEGNIECIAEPDEPRTLD